MLGPDSTSADSNMLSWSTKCLRVGPVVGDLARVVIAHHIGAFALLRFRASLRERRRSSLAGGFCSVTLVPYSAPDEAVHPPVVNVGIGGGRHVGATEVIVAGVVEGRLNRRR